MRAVPTGCLMIREGIDPAKLLRAQARIEDDSAGALGSFSAAARGILELSRGHVDYAIRQLESAARLEPTDARIASDLSAAYLTDERPYALFRAVSMAEHARRLKPDSLEARWNLAVALESTGLAQQAAEEWSEIARLAGSTWRTKISLDHAKDAMMRTANRTRLQQRLERAADGLLLSDLPSLRPGDSAEPIVDLLEQSLLPAWGHSISRGDLLRADRVIASAKLLVDQLPAPEPLRSIVLSVAAREPQERTAIGHAIERFGVALGLRDQRRISEAHSMFSGLPKQFVAFPALAVLAELYRIETDEQAPLHARLALIEELDRGSRDLPPLVKFRIDWNLGTLFAAAGNRRSVDYYQTAATAARSARMLESATILDGLIAGELEDLGDWYAAWPYRARSFLGLPDVRRSRGRRAILVMAAEAAVYLQTFDVGLRLKTEELRESEEALDSYGATSALLRRAVLMREAGLDPRPDLLQARQRLAYVDDLTLQQRLETRIALQEGVALSALEPARADALLALAQDGFADNGYIDGLIECATERGRLAARRGDIEAALRYSDEAIELLRRQVDLTSSTKARVMAFDHARPVLDFRIDVGSDAGAAEVVGLMERSRLERFVRGRGNGYEPPAVELCGVRSGPAGVGRSVLVFWELPDRIERAVINDRGCTRLPPIVKDALSKTLILAATSQGAGAWEALGRLSEIVIPPELREAPARQMVIVSDGIVDAVPFAGLLDSAGDYLVERSEIVFATSVTALAAAPLRASTSRPVLVGVGEPEPAAFPYLPPLSEVAAEIQYLRRLYPSAVTLTEASATPNAVRRAAKHATILHVAAHAETDVSARWRSRLVLFGKDFQRSVVRAEDVLSWDVMDRPLVTLGACGESADALLSAGGMSSLARAFALSGAGGVVASAWPVRDRIQRELLAEFHAGLGRGLRPSLALQQAQQRLLRSKDPELADPRGWGSYRLLIAERG